MPAAAAALHYITYTGITFSALMLLVGQREGHPACKKTKWLDAGVVICLGKSADVTATHYLLLQ